MPGKPAQPMFLTPSGLSMNTPDDVLDNIMFRHTTMNNILTNKLASIREVRDVWREDAIKNSIERLVSIRNSSVFVDVLRILLLKPSLLSLDVATDILPLITELLFETFEE